MGSRDMAFNKILSVLLVAGSFPAWTSAQFSSSTSSTTPVPILRYVDTQNIDGSYTYGYEAADGTYKLETRYTDGRVKGKYGYIDPDGNLREASYGAEAGRGFEPQIAGLELPPPVEAEVEAVNEIVQQPPRPKTAREGEIKVINGRRAVLKKVRRVKATPAPRRFIDESAQRQAGGTPTAGAPETETPRAPAETVQPSEAAAKIVQQLPKQTAGKLQVRGQTSSDSSGQQCPGSLRQQHRPGQWVLLLQLLSQNT